MSVSEKSGRSLSSQEKRRKAEEGGKCAVLHGGGVDRLVDLLDTLANALGLQGVEGGGEEKVSIRGRRQRKKRKGGRTRFAEFLLAVFPAPPFLAMGLFFFLKDEGILKVLTCPANPPTDDDDDAEGKGVGANAGREVDWRRRVRGEELEVVRREEAKDEMRREEEEREEGEEGARGAEVRVAVRSAVVTVRVRFNMVDES